MLNETAKGVFTIAVTPFLPDGAVDFDSVDSMVDAYIERGATGLTVLGMMGEAGKLSAEESIAVVKRVVARSSVPVVVGVSAPGFAAMSALSGASMDAGAAGVMVAPPTGVGPASQQPELDVDAQQSLAKAKASADSISSAFQGDSPSR